MEQEAPVGSIWFTHRIFVDGAEPIFYFILIIESLKKLPPMHTTSATLWSVWVAPQQPSHTSCRNDGHLDGRVHSPLKEWKLQLTFLECKQEQGHTGHMRAKDSGSFSCHEKALI